MSAPIAKQITDWLRKKLGEAPVFDPDTFWKFFDGKSDGETELGYLDGYVPNYDALQKEMEAWIAKEFPK